MLQDSDDDEEDDNGTDDSDDNSWQAEDSQPYFASRVSSFTAEKWKLYGTRESVTRSRDSYLKGGGTIRK